MFINRYDGYWRFQIDSQIDSQIDRQVDRRTSGRPWGRGHTRQPGAVFRPDNLWRYGVGVMAGLSIMLSGCQTGPRPFDGAVGYQLAQVDGTWYVRYTDQAVYDWKQLEQEALAACAGKTGADDSVSHLINMEKASFVDNVPTTVTYPAGAQAPATAGDGAVPNVPQSPVTFTAKEQVKQRLSLRQVTGQCPQ